MDQSASVMGLEGGTLYIKFTPSLDATPVLFPKCNPEFNFVIAKSYVQADKYTTGPVNYNTHQLRRFWQRSTTWSYPMMLGHLAAVFVGSKMPTLRNKVL